MPRMPVSGVRISWDMLARNWLLARFASRATSRAARSCSAASWVWRWASAMETPLLAEFAFDRPEQAEEEPEDAQDLDDEQRQQVVPDVDPEVPRARGDDAAVQGEQAEEGQQEEQAGA